MSNSSSKIGRWIAAVLAVITLLGFFYNMVVDNSPKGDVRQVAGYVPWDDEALKIAETIPVQNGGRIKPLSTFAGFTMYGLHGARSMKIEGTDGKKYTIKPTAWLMDTLFRPHLSANLPTFRIDNSAVLEAIGVKPRGKRDRYSYMDIEPAREKLTELTKTYEMIAKEKRDPVQEQTIALAYNLREYESLLGYFSFARSGVALHGAEAPTQRAAISLVMQTAPQIRQEIAKSQAEGRPPNDHLQSLMGQVVDVANFAKHGLNLLPPADSKEFQWRSAGDAIYQTFSDPKSDAKLAIEDITALELTAQAAGGNDAAFRNQLKDLRDRLVKRAEARGEYRHIRFEVSFYRFDWLFNSMIFFVIGLISALAMWTAGQGIAGRLFYWITMAVTVVGFALCVISIVQRCIITDRPPVGNLYDTIVFIAAAVVLFSLLIEAMTARGFALGIVPILAALLIILSRRFEVGDAKDYNDPLVAVLASNYWLTIHVLTITLGYAAGLLSAFFSFIYLLMRGLRLLDDDREARRFFTRAVYGMICLTLFLSLVGTVLGGIWANDSWGRFWGWDPKENGALLIVLWTLAILHARLGGYIKEWGLHLAAVFTGAVVVFSWWHVNFLNTGLHNYGFTAGKDSIWAFYAVVLAILIFGFIAMILERSGRQQAGLAQKES